MTAMTAMTAMTTMTTMTTMAMTRARHHVVGDQSL